ncbi:hypothetical protein MTP99_005718 [Tenebrio molitor]|nr:hypothetical protein MTP99_005718 [Tenebrio molitor]CAH1381800.1 unnamed protein product [Tenebrio molitor]
MHPVPGHSTVENKYFHPAGCLLNISVILLVEYMRRQKNEEKINLWRFKLPAWVYNAYYILLSFAFGQLCTILLTTVLKGSVGRLRPFFLIECAPNINCSLPENQHVYHVNYECTNKKFKQNTRLSFPSGHSSFAMYCALFLAIYIQKRMNWNFSNLLKSTVEFILILLALYVGISRVSDYKHHWSDVVGGFVIGGSFAIAVSVNLYCPFAPFKYIPPRPLNSVLPQ